MASGGINTIRRLVSLMPLANMWTILKERNRRAFENILILFFFSEIRIWWFKILDFFCLSIFLFFR